MTRCEQFISYVQQRSKADKGYASRLRKALSETTESQSWELLASWVDLDKDRDRKAFGMIGALATKVDSKGNLSLGLALSASYKRRQKGKVDSELIKSSEASKLRRLIACQDSNELLECLRPVLQFLLHQDINIDLSRLLQEILYFDVDKSRIDIEKRWARDFFGQTREDNDDSVKTDL
jgi:CRISPR type I-E-associated protein CasB/Cse2